VNSVRWRLTLWYATAVAAVLAVFAVTTFFMMRNVLERELDEELQLGALALADKLRHEFAEGEEPYHASESVVRKSQLRSLSLQIYGPDRELVASSVDLGTFELARGLDYDAVPLVNQGQHRWRMVEQPFDAHGLEVSAIRVADPFSEDTFTVVVCARRSPIVRELRTLGELMLTLAPLLVLVATGTGAALARHALSPVAGMSAQARRMGGVGSGERLATPNPNDELGDLAATFNELLDRIDAAFVRMREFVADASHELRTPVAVIRGEADVALTPPRSEGEAMRALAVIREEAMRLSKIVDDLFALVRADTGNSVHSRCEEVVMSGLLRHVVRAGEHLGREHGVSVTLGHLPEEELACNGDPAALQRMLMNLVDNATKYCGAGGTVEVSAARVEDGIEILVADNGPGVAQEYRDRVFERFFCVDRARTRDGGGAGLGLPIARAIAEAHAGTLTLDDRGAAEPGCVFRVRLPAQVVGEAVQA
jgi:signal transduction histidine kinase